MKKLAFLFCFIGQIVNAQTPISSFDATKGLSSATWQDQSGNNNHIKLSAPTTTTTDGVYFNGNLNALLSRAIPLSNFTIYMAVKVEAMDKTLLGTGVSGEYGLHYQKDILYSVTEQPATFFNTNTIQSNQTLVIALTRDVNKIGDNVTLFINGEEIRTFPNHRTKTFNLTNIAGEIGYQFKGWIKNVEIYNTVHYGTQLKGISYRLCPNPTHRYVSILNSIQATGTEYDGTQLVVFNNSLYSLGGWKTTNTVYNHVFKTDNLQDWSMVQDAAWSPRHTFGASVVSNKVFVYGADFQNLLYPNYPTSKDCWSTSDMKTWTLQTANAPFNVRILYGACVHQNNLYIIGGQKNLNTGDGISSIYKSSDGKNWQFVSNGIPEFETNISGHAVSFNGKLWVISGGYYNINGSKDYSSKVFSSVDGGVNWLQEANFPGQACQYANTVVYDNKLWFLFGNAAALGNLKQMWSMDTNGKWENIPNEMIDGRHATGVAVFKNRIVIACGNMHMDCWSILKI